MTPPSSIAKRLVLIALPMVALIVAAQIVFAAPPTASFSATGPNGGTSCGLWSFASTAQDDDGDINQAATVWTIDGTPSTGPAATATFGVGAHSVSMTVTDGSEGDGDLGPEQSTALQTVTVTNSAPTADIAPPTGAVLPNQAVTFSAAGSSDAGGGITQYEWDLDGAAGFEQTTTTPSASHTYATAGARTVRVRVTDTCGAQATESNTVTVQNPDSSFTIAPNPAQPNTPVTFTATDDPAITTYEWDLDGNGSYETNTAGVNTAQHTYTTGGTIGIRLRVTFSNGAQTVDTELLSVNFLPEANFTFDRNPPIVGEPVTFLPTGSRDFGGGTIATYEWDLDGNGTYETTGAAPPAHVYTAVGTVSVGLRVTDNENAVAEIHKPVVVQATRPNAALTFSPAHPVPGHAVRLTSTSTPSTTAGAPALAGTQWDFAFPATQEFSVDAAGGSVVTSFPTAGNKRVAVRVTDASGGFAIAGAVIPVNAPPQAAFTYSPAKPREGREATFVSTSTDLDGSIVKQEWDLNGDGKYERKGAVVSTTKLKRGNRRIALRVTDSLGAMATTVPIVKVRERILKPPLDVDSTVRYVPRSWGMTVTTFTVDVQSKTSVTVYCSGRGCPKAKFRQRSSKRGKLLKFRGMKGNLRAGATINVIYTRPGHATGWERLTVRGNNQGPKRFEGCKPKGAKKPKRCSSSG